MPSYFSYEHSCAKMTTSTNPNGSSAGEIMTIVGAVQFGGTGYTATVPYTVDLTSDYFNRAAPYGNDGAAGDYWSNSWSVAHVSYVNVHAVGCYDSTGAGGTQYRCGKIWHQGITFATGPFVLNTAANQAAYNSSTTWAVGTGNAGFARLVVSGNSLLLNFYSIAAPAATSVVQCLYKIEVYASHF